MFPPLFLHPPGFPKGKSIPLINGTQKRISSTVSAGDILLFSSHELHSWAVSRAGAEWKVFMFDKNLIYPDTLNLSEYRYLLPFIHRGNIDTGKLKNNWKITKDLRLLLKNIDNQLITKQEGYELEIKAALLLSTTQPT